MFERYLDKLDGTAARDTQATNMQTLKAVESAALDDIIKLQTEIRLSEAAGTDVASLRTCLNRAENRAKLASEALDNAFNELPLIQSSTQTTAARSNSARSQSRDGYTSSSSGVASSPATTSSSATTSSASSTTSVAVNRGTANDPLPLRTTAPPPRYVLGDTDAGTGCYTDDY
eukprot:GHVU01048328.1.p3 GENE.GHVU01048328.1~~GHVU01048328.1.p3  ORF type:complete len:174 (+),score=22.21 GHVU01048328.1:1462-1983(+)